MSRRRAIGLAVALLAIGFVVWRVPRGERPAPASSPSTAGPGQPKTGNAPRKAPAEERSALADALNAPTTNTQADLRLLADLLETFRSNFLQTGNPVGTNAEITAALSGKNKLRLSLIPADHPAINARGELCDRWGTPFFFHAEDAKQMEIRSAGPDRKMWNEDDVVQSP